MREWTREERYRKIEDFSKTDYDALLKKVKNAKWRQKFHLQAVSGLLNDPNGLVQKGDTYHVFFQWFPLGAVHGLKHWYHATSKDLVQFEYEGVAIEPDTRWDSHGAYSGSSILSDDEINVFYTGNHRDETWNRRPYQIHAVFNEASGMVEDKTCIIDGPHTGYTDNYRDPKVWLHEDTYYMLIGAETVDHIGCVVLYQSYDLEKWRFKGEIGNALGDFGYMWECPDLFSLDGNDVLLFSPQGISNTTDYLNVYQSGYTVGDFDYTSVSLDHGAFYLIDYGFDFYAPQTFENSEGDRILIGWMGLPETYYPSDEDGWAHCLTIPRRLSVEGDRVIQQPIHQLDNYGTQFEFDDTNSVIKNLPEIYNLEIALHDSDDFTLHLFENGEESFEINYSKADYTVEIQRHFENRVHCKNPGYRFVEMEEPIHQLQAIVDVSSVELFLNNGKYVLTSRVFPKEQIHNIKIHNIDVEYMQVYALDVE